MATPVQNWIGPHHDTIPILLELGVSSEHSSPMMQPITQPMQQAMTQPMTQPMPQAMTQAITQAMAQAVAQSVSQPMVQPMMQPMTQPITQPMTQAFERYDMETQTIPVWDHLMRMSLQTYLAHKLEPLLDTRLRGSKCIHLKGLSLDDLLAMVVERHNTLCVHPSVFEEKKSVVQIPLEQFSEADAAAKVMVDLLNAQHQHILDGNDLHSAGEGAFQNVSDEEPKQKTPRKRPAVSTKDDLLSKGVKLIRCDPPDHVIERAQSMWGTKQDRGRHIPAKQWYQCADCGLKLEDIHKLNRHITKHSTARSFQCPQCKRMYKTQDAVRKHVKESHNPGFKFKVFCAYCGKGFKSRKHRDDHVIVHTGERAFKCTECGKTFKNKRSVDGHMRTRHKIGKLHYCALCQCHFPFLNLLHNHLQTVHKAQVPQPMQQIFIRKCLICDVEFQDENILMQHMPSHGSQECTACTRRDKRRKHFIQAAVKDGMNQEEAATRDFESLEDWFREKKAVEMAEKKAKKEKEQERANLVVIDKAIQLGMEPELAKDVKQAQEFIKQKRKPEIPLQKKTSNKSSLYMKLTADNRPQLPQNEEYEIGDAGLIADVSKMSIEELRNCQIESQKQERQMKRAMEHMKKAVNQSAIEIALDIVESIEAEEVFGQSPKDKEMAIIRAELNARSKEGKPQKSLALIFGKRTVGLHQTIRKQDPNVMTGKESEKLTDAEKAAETLKEVIESQKLDPVLRLEAQNAYCALKEPVEKGLGMTIEEDGRKVLGLPSGTKKPVIPISIQKSSDASCSTNQGENENIKCTVYSQDPKLTLSLVKSGSATFLINKSQSHETKGIHLVSTKLGDDNKSVSPRIVISSNNPDKIKEKLTTGKLIINVVPLKGMKLVRKRTQFLSAALEVIDSVVDQEESKEEPDTSSNPSLDKKSNPVRVSARQKGGNIPSISSPKKAVSTRNNTPTATSKPKKTPTATSKQKKTPAAASKQKKKGPQLSTREELVQRGVKLILCDAPEHVVEKAKQMKDHKKSYNRATKQWYQCEHCGKKVEDISKLKLHIRVHDTLKDQLLRPTRSETETKTKASIPKPSPNQDSDLEPGEIRVEPLAKSQDTESVSKPQSSSTTCSNAERAMETGSPAKSSGKIESTDQESIECKTGSAQGKSSGEMKSPDQESMECDTGPAQGKTPAKSSVEMKSPDQESMECDTGPAQRETQAKSSEEMKSPDPESMECETTAAQGETPASSQSDVGEQFKTTATTATGPKFYCRISEVPNR